MKTCCLKSGVKIKLKFNKRVYVNELTKDKILQIVGAFEFKNAVYFGKKYTNMAMIPAGFDIECYEQYMYIWTFTIKDTTIIGYTWDEFKDMCALIKDTLNLGKRYKKTIKHRKTDKHEARTEDIYTAPWVMPVFIHNIKYEYAFMMSQINVPEDTFFCDKAKLNPLFVVSEDAFVFIDSYKIYPHALEDIAKMYCKTRKTHDLDYNTPRNIKDAKHLSSKELDYCVNDTKILSELMQYTFDTYFIPYNRMPLTQNQIVKNIIHYEYDSALQKMDKTSAEKYEKELKRLSLDQEQYDFIRGKGFRGGLCLSSEDDYTGDVIYGDETSAYFAAIMHGKYPMSKYRPVMILPKTVEKIDALCNRYCCQMKIKFYKLVSKGSKY